MTTDPNGTRDNGRLSLPAAIAKLLLLQQQHGLPDPQDIMTAHRQTQVELKFPTREALDAWLAALGGEPHTVTTYPNGGAWAVVRAWHGWLVDLDWRETRHTTLDAETIAALEAVAANV